MGGFIAIVRVFAVPIRLLNGLGVIISGIWFVVLGSSDASASVGTTWLIAQSPAPDKQPGLNQRSPGSGRAQQKTRVMVLPGLLLPEEDGLYIVDRDRHRISRVEHLKVDKSMCSGRPVKERAAAPYDINKCDIEISGTSAEHRVYSAEPQFHYRPSDGRQPRFFLVRAEISGRKRQLNSDNEIPIEFHGGRGVYRFTANTLRPGEYAVLERSSDGTVNYIWDFAVALAGQADQAPNPPDALE
jgi:hypothetical protein